jgi:transcriptional regulator with XRE-family HTH domain
VAEKDPRLVRLGGRVRELREGAGLSREQLAAAAGVSLRAVVQWELGEREPGWFNILALAEALGEDCTAFTRPPAERPPPAPGRPRKEPPEEVAPKRPRGRPRKDQAADLPPTQGKPARRKPPRPRGG